MASGGEPLQLPGALPNANMRLYGGAQFHRCDCSGAPGHSLFLARHLLLSPALRGPAPSANLQIAWPASEAPSFDRSQTDLPAALHLFQLCSAMAEFRLAVGQLTCPDISREEIVNACGVDDVHDGGTRARRAARGAAFLPCLQLRRVVVLSCRTLWAARICQACMRS